MSEAQVRQELREKVALACRIIGGRGVTKGASGHVSARIPGTDRILIKAKGPDEEALEFATERDIILIDIEGAVLEAPDGLDAPNETSMHLAVYRARPEVGSVIHSHPAWVVALLACDKPLVPIYRGYDGGASLRMLEEGIPIYPRSVTIVNDDLGQDFMRTMGKSDACLLRGHGMTTAGRTVEQATSVSMNVFEIARVNYAAYAAGLPLPVPDLEAERGNVHTGNRPRRPRENAEGPSDWRWHKKWVDRRS